MPKWLDDILEGATKYSPLIKTGVAALSTYASFKDQQKKNQLQKDAYDDYMAQADAAGHAARAAIDINYTPMTVSGVPTSKADVTDFTAVAARGGLMNLPTKQRKKYYGGTNPNDIPTMDELNVPFDPREEGISIGEQVFYDTGRGDRANASQIWSQMQNPDKAIFDFDFEIFFMDGGWRDMIKSEVEVGTETQMASAPDPTAEMNDFSINTFGKPLHELTPDQLQDLYDLANEQASARPAQGIMQAAKGGRIGYRYGTPETVVADQETILKTPNEEVVTNQMEEIKGQTAGPQWYQDRYDHLIFLGYSEIEAADIAYDSDKYYEAVGHDPFAKGGRVKRDNGGIMNLGGLEKDYRTTGGFVPIGAYEKKDDVPARLSKNEFVMTADAVRAAGGGSINRGAQRMYDTMKNLEARPTAKRMTA